MELRVVTWNAEGMFAAGSKTRRASPVDGVNVLKDLDADIVVIPEFGRRDLILQKTLQAITDLSYEYVLSEYDDKRAPELYFAILSKLPIIHHRKVFMHGGSRSASLVECRLEDGSTLTILGVHLDDRSEVLRLQQITSIVDTVNANNTTPILVMGDFNAMSEKSLFAQFARSVPVRYLTNFIRHRQLKSVIERVSEMAIGTTIRYLLDGTSLKNLDTKLQRTISAKQAGIEWMPSYRIGKIDWMFGSKDIVIRSYEVMRDVGSDHRPCIADIAINARQ